MKRRDFIKTAVAAVAAIPLVKYVRQWVYPVKIQGQWIIMHGEVDTGYRISSTMPEPGDCDDLIEAAGLDPKECHLVST